MTDYLFAPATVPSLPVRGSEMRFPVHRIYCVGRNFADHAKEMAATVERGTPMFFMKPADAVVPGGGEMPFPSATSDLHHEVELVVALGRDAEGVVAVEDALSLVYGYAVGLDLTRRDLQAIAKDKRLPWDTAKGFDRSAPISEIVPSAVVSDLTACRLWLEVNGEPRQASTLGQMVFTVPEIVHALSKLYELKAGDLIMMGTPAGVAALAAGDSFRAGIDGVVEFAGRFAD